MAICMMKLAAPRLKMKPTTSASSLKFFQYSLNATPLVSVKYQRTERQETPWPSTVAKALPTTPQPSTITNRKFSTTHATVPMTMVSSARFGAPAVRMKLFTPMPMIWKITPRLMMRTKL